MLVVTDTDSGSDTGDESPEPAPTHSVVNSDNLTVPGDDAESLLHRAELSSRSRSRSASLSKRLTFRRYSGGNYSQIPSTIAEEKTEKPLNKKKKKQDEEISFCKWFMRCKWITRLPFVYFMVGVIAVPSLAMFHFMDADTTYLVVSAYIILSIFGMKHFYTLLNLKKEVDGYSVLNRKFASESVQLREEVKSLRYANQNLRESERRIHSANAENRENLKQFTDVQHTMETLNVANVEELQKIADNSVKIAKQWQKQVVEQERDMLHTVFDRFECRSNKAGMTSEDFASFSKELPRSYQARFARLGTFDNLSTDGVYISFSDFDAALDVFAEMEAYDCDIDFTIEKEAKEASHPMQLSLDDKTVSFSVPEEEEAPEDWTTMKRWKTRRKEYHDNVSRKVVVHRRTFIDPKRSKLFTAALGLLDECSEELPNELPSLMDEDSEEHSFSFDFSRADGNMGRHSRQTSLIQAGQQIVDARNAIKLDLLMDDLKEDE